MGSWDGSADECSSEKPLTVRILTWLGHIIRTIPIAIIGILTHFRKGESTHAQRAWMMTWLVFGIFVGNDLTSDLGSIKRYWSIVPERSANHPRFWGALIQHLLLFLDVVVLGAPAIGGFIVVGQMLNDYGNCIRFN